jgi:hypothetical protein
MKFKPMRPIPLRFFLITHTPVELGRPLQLGLRLPTPRTEELFARFKEHVDEHHKRGETNPCMLKEDVYKWIGGRSPCGPRVRVVEVFVDPDRLR